MKLKEIVKKVFCGIKKAWLFLDDRKRWRLAEDWLIYKICGVLFLAAFFFAVCILIVFFKAFADWRLSIGAEGVNNMQLFWQQHSSLIKAFFYTLTLFIASHTLIKYIDVETCRSLGEIRTKLNETPKKIINDSLLDSEYRKSLQDKVEKYFKAHPEYVNEVGLSAVEMLDYLGTLELGALMLRRGLLSDKEFFDQFGYRYVYLSRSPIMDMLNEEENYYEPLLFAMAIALKINDGIKEKEEKKNTEKIKEEKSRQGKDSSSAEKIS